MDTGSEIKMHVARRILQLIKKLPPFMLISYRYNLNFFQAKTRKFLQIVSVFGYLGLSLSILRPATACRRPKERLNFHDSR